VVQQSPPRICDCRLSEKLLYTSFLLLMGVAYLMALTYLYTSHEGHDGQPGLSVRDIAETYYGNRSGTRLEAAIRGPMAGFIERPEDRDQIVAWLKSGATEDQYVALIQPILERSCVRCHSPASGLAITDFTRYAELRAVADVDTGESLHSLMRLSHIHLFGIGLIAFSIGLIFRFTVLPTWFKGVVMVTPFVAIFADITAWFLTKWDPLYAYTVLIAGALLGAAWAIQIFVSLFQLWVYRSQDGRPSRAANRNVHDP